MEKTFIYRVTHLKNMPHVLKYGVTHRNSLNKNPLFTPIGDSTLISTRNNKTTPFGTVIGDYIPFYFCCKSPMVYVIQKGFNGVPIQRPANLVYIVTSIQEVIKSEIPFIYTDGHATDMLSSFYDSSNIKNLYSQLDFEAINIMFWRDEKDLDLKRRKEAEFLLQNDLPKGHILGFIVYDEYTKKHMLELGFTDKLIHISPKRYF